MKAAILTLSIAAVAATTLIGQDQRPSFRATTRLIVQAVTVKDHRGQPIEHLAASDFEVTENGRPQTIAFVEYQRLGRDAVAPPRLPAPPARADLTGTTRLAIQPPAAGDARYRDRRLLIFYFDLSTMPSADAWRAFSGALTYVERRMTPADAVAIVTYDGGAVRVREDFTDDRDRLMARLRLLAAGGDGNGDGVADELEAGSAFGENDAEFNVFSTDRQLAALQSAIRQLRPIPEQKALVYFGSGLRLNGVGNQAQIRATVNAAVRANVTINPIDARGLVAFAPMGDATRATPAGVALFSGTLAQNAANRFQRSQDTLHALAKDTGGQALFDHNDLTLGVVQAAEAVSSYYLLGYYSTEISNDGRFRRVRVSVRNRPGATLAYRDGYAGDKVFGAFTAADKERQLEEALRLDDPVTEVTLAVEVNTFRLNRSEYYVPVSLKIPGRELSLARRRGAPRTLIDVIGEVKDEHGVTHRNLRDKLDIRLDQERAAVWTQRPIQYETGFTLLPGTYVLKVLVRDATTGRIGTYQAPFSVRNAERDADVLPISTVVLGTQRLAAGEALHTVQQAISTSSVNPLIVDGRQLLPSVTRVFSVTRDVHVLLHAYRTATITPEPLLAYAALYRDDLKRRETAPLIVGSAPAGPKSLGLPVMLTMPLAGLEPGPYECQVTVLSPTSGKVAFFRADVVLTK